ncbi:hypothetical protein A2Z22_00450 [Candidatus Woesebacteria bacterium RBG_16_34_12]|uniref:HAD family hydrolase n=1 Tax=Candidatus Woesebacteria bacterium RBG_16_34_12 TaxID=1802480 RepID=A0A1F7XAX6_9BACT|nr:MAG: hypothetical protein A2Z22_00450 [Candidatus Woesebacteria bacterium RBG_16_34_12]
MIKLIIFDFYKTLYNPKTNSLYRGTYSILKILSSKYSLVLISSSNYRRKLLISRLDIKKYFKKVIVVNQKTESVYRKLKPQMIQTLIIGDRTEEEILFGKNLGCKTLQVNPDIENPIETIKKKLLK